MTDWKKEAVAELYKRHGNALGARSIDELGDYVAQAVERGQREALEEAARHIPRIGYGVPMSCVGCSWWQSISNKSATESWEAWTAHIARLTPPVTALEGREA